MKKFSYLLLLLALFPVSNMVHAQYWFQSGAIAATSYSNFNNGASVSIQTVYPQNLTIGSYGFWVGETLNNGAFLQIGYEIPNQTGYYSSFCNPSECSQKVYLVAGEPAWFWEYFTPNSTGNVFYGGMGNSSLGPSGAFNTYSFKLNGNTWYFFLNGNVIGNVNLGAANSGLNPPSAIAEYADTNNNNTFMDPVIFENLSYYKNGQWTSAPIGYSFIGYGKGSLAMLKNSYGVMELDNKSNYFEVGSGLRILPNNTELWKSGHYLTVVSQYGNINSTQEYFPNAQVSLNAQKYYSMDNGERAVFVGWTGYGPGSYTGNQTNINVQMNSNITEIENWKVQYYVNVSSSYDNVYGSGWYDNGSTAEFGIKNNISMIGYGTRASFIGWDNGYKQKSASIVIESPQDIVANWVVQYEVNFTSEYGKIYGNGWYANGTTAHIYLTNSTTNIDGTSRIKFKSWSYKFDQTNLSFSVDGPVFLDAIYSKQYVVDITPENSYGNPVYGVTYATNYGSIIPYSFIDANTSLNISGAYYKDSELPLNKQIIVTGPISMSLQLPIYNVTVRTLNYFYLPVNSTLNITFYNGTTLYENTGSKGYLKFTDVPLGYINGYVNYLGLKESFHTGYQSELDLFMFSPLFAVVIIFAMGAIVLAMLFLKRKRVK